MIPGTSCFYGNWIEDVPIHRILNAIIIIIIIIIIKTIGLVGGSLLVEGLEFVSLQYLLNSGTERDSSLRSLITGLKPACVVYSVIRVVVTRRAS